MVLLVSRAAINQEVIAWVGQQIGFELHAAVSLEEASRWLRGSVCLVTVVDSGWLETDPEAVDHLLCENPALVPVFPNLAVCGPERLVCEIKAALRRGGEERQPAVDCARPEVSTPLQNSITAILLNFDLAPQISQLSHDPRKKMLPLHHLATQ